MVPSNSCTTGLPKRSPHTNLSDADTLILSDGSQNIEADATGLDPVEEADTR